MHSLWCTDLTGPEIALVCRRNKTDTNIFASGVRLCEYVLISRQKSYIFIITYTVIYFIRFQLVLWHILNQIQSCLMFCVLHVFQNTNFAIFYVSVIVINFLNCKTVVSSVLLNWVVISHHHQYLDYVTIRTFCHSKSQFIYGMPNHVLL